MRPVSIVEGLFLVGSNLALLPAIRYAYVLGLLPESSILSVVFVVSSVYHLCQAGFICLLDIDFLTFQLQDHFFVYGALVWITLYFIGLTLAERFAIFIWVQALLFPLILEFVKTWWLSGFVVGFVVLIAILLLSIVVRGFPRFNIYSMIAAILLVGVGFAFHLIGGDPTPPDQKDGETNHKYAWFHSAWHVFIMLSVYYVIDLKHGHSWLVWFFRHKKLKDDVPTVLSLHAGRGLPTPKRTRRGGKHTETPERCKSKKKGKTFSHTILTLGQGFSRDEASVHAGEVLFV